MMLSVYVLVALTAITQSTSSDGQTSVEVSQADEALSPSGNAKRPNPIPKGNPGHWANTNDYPAVALQKHIEGTTGFRVKVGPDGLVTECMIISSSGSSDLDQATCTNVQRRARFDPALDAEGKPVSGFYANRVRWQIPTFALMEAFPRAPISMNRGWTRLLPEDFPPAALSEKREGTVKVELSIPPGGGVSGCKAVKLSGHADLDEASCKIALARAKFDPAVDVNGQPTAGRVMVDMRWIINTGGTETPAYRPPTLDIFPEPLRSTFIFKVNKDGSFVDCKSESTNASPGKVADLFCGLGLKRKPYLDAEGNPVARIVKVTEIVEMEDAE